MFANPVRPAVCCTLLACPLADFLDFWKKQDLTSDDCRDLALGICGRRKDDNRIYLKILTLILCKFSVHTLYIVYLI
jgi:hypothetical protein